jgi:prefoldin beta subunit
MDKETENQIKELQILEQNLQSLLMQKQAFQMELSETENALEELNKSNDETFKIVGNIMIKYSKENLLKDLKQKNDLISLRLKSIETQERSLTETSENLRKKVLSKIRKQ